MNIFLFLLTFISFIWVVAFVPFNILVMLRSLIHNYGYQYSINDTISGLAIGILMLYGTPILTGMHELKFFLGY